MHCYGELPLKIFCLGHCDQTKMRIHLARCVLMYENLESYDDLHESCHHLFAPGTRLRNLVDSVIAGTLPIEDVLSKEE